MTYGESETISDDLWRIRDNIEGKWKMSIET